MEATRLYLVRHGATAANLAQPTVLQGRRLDLPLAPLGVRQAEATRDALAGLALDRCFTSPLLRARQTATILAAAHGLVPCPAEALTEGDMGRWEGLSWEEVRSREAEQCHRFQADPWEHGYPGGESLKEVHTRTTAFLDDLLQRHAGQTLLVVSHHVVLRVYLARLLGLPPGRSREVTIDNCGLSLVVRQVERISVVTLNATEHLQGASP